MFRWCAFLVFFITRRLRKRDSYRIGTFNAFHSATELYQDR